VLSPWPGTTVQAWSEEALVTFLAGLGNGTAELTR
jgi:hypothetical protein